MAASVEVLCPSGHRQKIKITPNTKILQILEEVCTKKGFLPAEEYELKHGRKALDVTLTVRFAGLPNHAKLELVKSQKTRTESEVTIALQVEAARLQHAFPPSTTLWEVLQHWDQQQDSEFHGRLTCGGGADQQLVLTYMREEVVGDFALQETSLRALGLTSGRALLRLSHRQVDKDVLDEMRENLEKEKSRQERLKLKAQSNIENNTAYNASANQTATAGHSNTVPMDTDTPVQLSTSETRSQPMEVTSAASLADQPMEEVVTSGARAAREGRLGEATTRSRQQRQEDSLQDLERLPGVEVIRPDDFNHLTPADQAKARQMAANVFPGIFPQERRAVRPKTTPEPEVYQPPAPNPFANFKFPEETKGKDLYKNDLSDVKSEEFLPCDRETCLYSLDEVQQKASTSASDDIPDDFFEVTVSDVQRMYADLQTNLTTYGEQPLMTSTMRQQAAEERMSRYPRVILRIQFPDRLVLQAVFRPRETVFTLNKFVKEHLADKNTPFYLYTTPPKCILKDKAATLYEAHLVPMTVVLFGSEMQADHYLSDAALCEVGPRSNAERIVYTHMADKSGEGTSDSGRPRPKRNIPSTSSTGTSDPPKVPKWFKAGKK